MRRRAVLVGCNANSLNRAPWNDVLFLRNILFWFAGFALNDMLLICDNDPENLPTSQSIMQAMEAMTMNASPDDFLLLFFTGHGCLVDGDIWLMVNQFGDTIQGHYIRQWACDAQHRCDCVRVIIDSCFSGGVFANFFNRVDLWSDPWVIVFASCLADENSHILRHLQVDGSIIFYSAYTYYFCRTIMNFGGHILTNYELDQEVFQALITWMEQNPRLDCPLGFLEISWC